jgi:hypothetical protein
MMQFEKTTLRSDGNAKDGGGTDRSRRGLTEAAYNGGGYLPAGAGVGAGAGAGAGSKSSERFWGKPVRTLS